MTTMHYIRKNHSNASPTDCIFFDCETLPEEGGTPLDYGLHKLWFGYAIYVRRDRSDRTRRRVCRFDSRDTFWQFVRECQRPKATLWVFAHNLGFDATIVGLWERVRDKVYTFVNTEIPEKRKDGEDNKNYRKPLIVLDDPPSVCRTYDKVTKTWLTWIDTLNYWRTSLSVLGKGVGIQKLPMPKYPGTTEEWNEYCLRDVEVIEQAVCGLIDWVRTEDLGKFRYTSPSQSMAAYRHRFMNRKIVTHDNDVIRSQERKAYYGGHVEIFTQGPIADTVHQLDVTSLYPSVMRGAYYPYRLSDQGYGIHKQDDGSFPYHENMVAHVVIDTLERTYPRRTKEGIIHTIGYYDTWLCGPELATAIKSNHVASIMEWSTYDLTSLFTEFVDYFWSKRLEYKAIGNILGDVFCKLMMNSLYGKFGQLGGEWQQCEYYDPPVDWGQWTVGNLNTRSETRYRKIGDIVERFDTADEIEGAFPAIAAFVTAYGREKMMELRSIAGQTHVHYQAVDALYVDDVGLSNLQKANQVGRKELGKLELVSSCTYAHFWNLNNYVLGGKYVRGSVKANAKKIGVRTVEEPHFAKLDTILALPLTGGVAIQRRVKTLSSEYTRGSRSHTGKTIPTTLVDSTLLPEPPEE